MQALILAGGEGTRLLPLTLKTPKPIVPIGNKPFLFHQIIALKSAGITDITISLNYQPSAIEQKLSEGFEYGVNLRFIVEPLPMGTAGAYKFAEKYLTDTTLVLNGDILTDINFKTILDYHQQKNAESTIVLVPVENPSEYGLVQYTSDFRILQFLEKPSLEIIKQLQINTINAGIYIFNQSILEKIPSNQKYSFEYQLFPSLLAEKSKFYAFVAQNNYWIDIGTPEKYLRANLDLISQKIKLPFVEIQDNAIFGQGYALKKNVTIKNSVIGNKVEIKEDVLVENSVIWDETKIEAGKKIIGSIVSKDFQT